MSSGSIGRNLFTSRSRGVGSRLGSGRLGQYRDPDYLCTLLARELKAP